MSKTYDGRLRRAVRDITERYQAAGYFPSACVRVFNREETVACVCVGEAEESSLFDVASLTKIATTTQILHLIEAGKLSLLALVLDALPPLQNDAFLARRFEGITLYQLLTHTSTLPAWYPFYSRQGEDFYTVLKYALQHTEPTQGMVYSDLNFMLLGKIIEHTHGKPLENCLQENLVKPLGLGNMTYLPEKSYAIVPSCYGNPIETQMCADRGIPFHGFRPLGQAVRGEANDGNCFYYFHGVSGHAGIFADAPAYERLCQYYMKTALPLLIEAQQEQPAVPGRGIGFQTGLSYPHGCGHTGFTGTGIYFSREYNVGVVSFTNRLFYPHENENATWEFRRVLHEAAFALAANAAEKP